MAKYRSKPIIIEAVQLTRNNWDEITDFTNGAAHSLVIEKRINGFAKCLIRFSGGDYEAWEGDYIVKGAEEYFPREEKAFEKAFEIVEI